MEDLHPNVEKLVNVPRWYVVETHLRQEALAQNHLERQGFRTLAPSVRVRRRRSGRWQSIVEPLFPGYLFIELVLGEHDATPVRSTIGCKGMVRFGLHPLPVPKKVIEPIIALGDEPMILKDKFLSGDKVRLEDGVLEGLEAIYCSPQGEDRAQVLLEILGRKSVLSLDRDLLTKPL